MGKLTLILGGARSGKSTYAEKLASSSAGQVVYIATAQPLDQEMQARIQNHRDNRPDTWRTLEVPRFVARNLPDRILDADVILLDCLTLLVTNILMEDTNSEDEPDEIIAAEKVEDEIEALFSAIRRGGANWIVVSNEVGLGLVPPYPLGRVYRDLLGKTNRQFAEFAEEVYFMVAGIPLPLNRLRSI